METEKQSIRRLNDTNYPSWANEMKWLLVTKKYWRVTQKGISEGSKTRSKDEEEELDQEARARTHRAARWHTASVDSGSL